MLWEKLTLASPTSSQTPLYNFSYFIKLCAQFTHLTKFLTQDIIDVKKTVKRPFDIPVRLGTSSSLKPEVIMAEILTYELSRVFNDRVLSLK